MSMEKVRAFFSSLKEKAQALCSWLRDKCLAAVKQAQTKACGYLTQPLSEDEYAMLKRMSAIVGTAVAFYLLATSGLTTVLVVAGLCVLLAYALQLISKYGKSLAASPSLA